MRILFDNEIEVYFPFSVDKTVIRLPVRLKCQSVQMISIRIQHKFRKDHMQCLFFQYQHRSYIPFHPFHTSVIPRLPSVWKVAYLERGPCDAKQAACVCLERFSVKFGQLIESDLHPCNKLEGLE